MIAPGRRACLDLLLRCLAASVVGGAVACGPEDRPPRPPPRPLPPLATGDLATLLPAAGLVWAVRTRPREIAQVPWLIPAIASFAPEQRLDRHRESMGYDLRQATEAWFARYDLGGGACDLTVVHHNARPEELERSFLHRLSKDPLRVEDRPDLVRVTGRIGAEEHAFARLGRDVAAWQERGQGARGPLRIAAARAEGRLGNVRDLRRAEPLGPLLERFGTAPVIAVAPGPFDEVSSPEAGGDAARLLSVATGLGASLRPTARQRLGLAIAVAGDFADGAAGASEVLRRAWEHLAASETGRILALDRAPEAPLATHNPGAVAIAVELDPAPVAEGLRALVEQDIGAILGGRP